MDNSDEDNNNGEDFQLVTRKRRGKGKNARTHSAKDSDVESQSVGSNNFRYTSGQGRCRNVNRGYINYGEPFCDEIDVAERVSLKDIVDVIRLDAALTQPPRYNEEKPEEDKSEHKIPHGNDQESRPVIEKINTRFLAKEAATYELEKFEKNAMLIFNHTNVDGYSLPRLGTEKDVAELERTFTNFGFEVAVKHDLKKYQIMEKLKEFTSQDFTDYGCVAVVVLSHGSNDGRIRAKDMPYSELEIVNQLLVRNKPTLVTKPRLFIVQACRGTQNIRGVPVGYADRIQKDTEEEVETYTLPVESDMLVLHSSYIGKPSHRDELDGSWFIQTLCRKINQRSANADLLTILTEVNREVAIDKSHKVLSRVTDEYDINKQMPAFTSTLTRGLYLRRYGSPSPGLESVSDGGACAHSRAVTDNSMPSTPMTLSASCACFLDHFEYIKNCLSHYLEDNPEDSYGQSFLILTDTFTEDPSFYGTKETTAKLICQHLREKGRELPYLKYLYFYTH